MGRQWLHAKREVAGLKKGQVTGKLVKEIMVAAKLGGADPAGNARLAAVVEKARKQSVSRDVIERAIKKGAGIGGEKLELEQIVFEGYGPHKVPVIVEVQTDNKNRTGARDPRPLQARPARCAGEQQVSFRSCRARRGAPSRCERGCGSGGDRSRRAGLCSSDECR